MRKPTQPPPFPEFIVLLALTISIVAMATDIMLPALQVIGEDLAIADPNDAQLIVTTLFIGFAAGLLVAGPLSDSFGRKPVILAGYGIFAAGCLLSISASDLPTMLAGRILQGFGASAPRIVSISLVRDGYEGRAMARIMSIVMSIFILAPMVAPAIGQCLTFVAGWRSTFVLMLALAAVGAIWLALRQPETLPPPERRRLAPMNVMLGFAEALAARGVVGYSLTAGLVFGAFIAYLGSAQQIFTITFGVGELFPLYFAIAAGAFGAASLANSMMVMRLGMPLLSIVSLLGVVVFSGAFAAYLQSSAEPPPLALFMTWLLATFFCIGGLWGNLNALAMEPLGHMAGLGAALTGSIATAVSVPLGWAIGRRFDGSVEPLVMGFLALGIASLAVIVWTARAKTPDR